MEYGPWSEQDLHDQFGDLDFSFANVNQNWVSVVIRRNGFTAAEGDFFDDQAWDVTVEQFRLLARVARSPQYQCVGILFDNEQYFEGVWNYPDDVAHADQYSLEEYQAKSRQRGREIFQAIQSEWPEAKMLFTHGPYRSAPEDRPFEVSMNQVGSHDNYELDAPFFYAMAIEADDQQVIDGGEVYQLRTENQFQINHSWRSTDIAQSVVVPEELRAPGVYADRVGVTHGLYNLTWPNEDFPMSPTIMRSTLRNALRSSSQPVWIFIESDETWLLPGGFPDQWRTNIENGFNDAFALNEVNVFRGVVVSGGLEEVRSSDDNYLLINPGFTLNASEAPAWIEFFGTVADDASVFAIESSAGTPNLLYTVEAGIGTTINTTKLERELSN